MATPNSYLIKKGDTLSKIANQYNTTPSALMSANTGNPAIKNQNLIIEGGNINLPEAPADASGTAAVTPSTVVTTPSAAVTGGGAPGAVESQSVPSDDWSAGFATYMKEMGDVGNSINALNTEAMTASGAIQNSDGTWNYNPTPQEVAVHQQNLAAIKENASSATEDVGAAAKTAQAQSARAGELLGMSPAAIKYNVDLYTDENDQLLKSIADAYSKIEEDQNTATINEDYSYVQQLQSEKLNLIQTQRTAINDRATLLTNAFNSMLGAKQESRLSTDDAITKVQNLYQMNQIPSQADWNAAGFSGTPPKALNTVVWSQPTMQNGKMVQTNKQTGEVRVLSISEYGAMDPVQQEQRVTDDVTAFKNGTITSWSSIQDPDERAAAMSAYDQSQQALLTPSASTSTPTLSGMFNWLHNSVSSLFPGSNDTSTATNSTNVSAASSTDTIDTTYDAVQDQNNLLNDIHNTN